MKASRGQYRKAKLAAVACSGFLSLFLPMTGWLLFCKFIFAYFRKLLAELNEKEGVTIILTSHYSEDIQELCWNTYYMDLLRAGL